MSVIVRVLFLLVVSSVSAIKSAPCNKTDTSCNDSNRQICKVLNNQTSVAKIKASFYIKEIKKISIEIKRM